MPHVANPAYTIDSFYATVVKMTIINGGRYKTKDKVLIYDVFYLKRWSTLIARHLYQVREEKWAKSRKYVSGGNYKQ